MVAGPGDVRSLCGSLATRVNSDRLQKTTCRVDERKIIPSTYRGLWAGHCAGRRSRLGKDVEAVYEGRAGVAMAADTYAEDLRL